MPLVAAEGFMSACSVPLAPLLSAADIASASLLLVGLPEDGQGQEAL